MAQDYDSNEQIQVQETIEQQQYTRVLKNCDDAEFNQNISVLNKLNLTSKINKKSKFYLGKILKENIPGFENNIQNQQELNMNDLEKLNYNRSAKFKHDERELNDIKRPPLTNHQPIATLPNARKDKQQQLVYTQQQQYDYNPVVNAYQKENYINNINGMYSQVNQNPVLINMQHAKYH